MIGQRQPGPDETGGGSVVLVDTLTRHGLPCKRCGGDTRSEIDVHAAGEGGGDPIAQLEGCTECRTGLYRLV